MSSEPLTNEGRSKGKKQKIKNKEKKNPEILTVSTYKPPNIRILSADLEDGSDGTNFSSFSIDTVDDLSDCIYALLQRVTRIENYSKDIDSAKDSEILRKKLKREREIAKDMASQLLRQLKIFEADREMNEQERFTFSKVTKQFSEVFENYERVNKDSIQREKKAILKREQILSGMEREDNIHSEHKGYGLFQQQIEDRDDDIDAKLALASHDASNIDAEKAMAKEMYDDLSKLEVDMTDLQTLYLDIKSMVVEQQDGIDEISTNLQTSNKHVETGVTHVREATKSFGKTMILICILIVVVILIAIAIVGLVLLIVFLTPKVK